MGMVTSFRTEPAATLRKAAHIQQLLEPGAIEPVYQPIVRLSDLEVIGYEGLARFPYADGLSHMPPDVTLAAAGEIGLREDLEVACWGAMAKAGSPPGGRLLFVNISPHVLGHPGLAELADKLPSRLVIEITEQSEVTDYAELRERLAPWVARGAALAVDDTGAGYASLEHVVELRPDFLKLTRSLVADIDKDANRQALLRALMAFAKEVGAGIVAEGVEREEEMQVLREAEVDYAQGWLFGKPGPPWPKIPDLKPRIVQPSLTDSGVKRIGRLEREVAGAPTIDKACDAIADHLGRMGFMPSVYLEQGGRLRCRAARGYWQVYDGIPASAGVIGKTFREGKPVIIDDVAAHGEYLGLIEAVKAEVGIPLRIGERVVGVVNVESTTPLGEGPTAEIMRCASLLSRRLAEFGPLDVPTPGQRLARAAARAADMMDRESVVREAASAALDVSGMESVMVVLRDVEGVPSVTHATGPFADSFRGLSTGELSDIEAWVSPGTVIITMGDVGGRAPATAEPLRRAGAGALAVLPLTIVGQQLGLIVLTDRSNVVLATHDVELLELLCVQTAAQLGGLAAVSEMRARAARDPLTGLGHHATFHARLPRRRELAQANETRLAVVLADVDGFKGLNDERGHKAGDEVLRAMANLLREIAPAEHSAFRLGGDEFAVLVECDGRGGAQQLAWDLQARARDVLGTTLSIGVALADEAESDAELLERADEALLDVKRRGRDGVALAGPRLGLLASADSV